MSNKLHYFGGLYGSDKATYHGFCEFYEKELEGFTPDDILEIGVLNGASLRMWKAFYPKAIVVGIDINTPKTVFDVEILQVDASDIYEMEYAFHGMTFDLIIDDGSHKTKDQQTAFHYLYHEKLTPGGFYIMEDIHTSFSSEYVNSRFNTYELLKTKYPESKIFWKDPNNQFDSGTMIIKKPL